MFRTRSLVALLLLALAGLLAALGREGQREAELGRGPDRAGGKVERCVTCHVRPEEDPGGAHARAAVGCSSCHLGNELAFDKKRAHAGMEPEPGALRTVSRTCGRAGCHVREARRVSTSLMARASGIVSVNRWAFGEIPEPRGTASMVETLAKADPSPAERHLGKLCAGCHLHTLRGNRDDAIHGNGSGCASCHVARRLPGAVPRPHPAVDARVTDDRCLGCHSRSGRIALTYEGLYEVEKDQAGACGDAATTLHDGRPACRAEADVHRLAGLSCVDCHLHTDLMGDGREWEHSEDQVEITCEACHGPVRGGSRRYGDDVGRGDGPDLARPPPAARRDAPAGRARPPRPPRHARLEPPPLGLRLGHAPKGPGRRSRDETDADRPEPCTPRSRAAHVQLLPRGLGPHLLHLPHAFRDRREAVGLRTLRRDGRPLGRDLGRLRRPASRPRRPRRRPGRSGDARNGHGPRRDGRGRTARLPAPLLLVRPALHRKESAHLRELPSLPLGSRPRHGDARRSRDPGPRSDPRRQPPDEPRMASDAWTHLDAEHARRRHARRLALSRRERAPADARRRSLSPVSRGCRAIPSGRTSARPGRASRGAGRGARSAIAEAEDARPLRDGNSAPIFLRLVFRCPFIRKDGWSYAYD